MKYAWIKEHRDEYSVVRLCHASWQEWILQLAQLRAKPSKKANRFNSQGRAGSL